MSSKRPRRFFVFSIMMSSLSPSIAFAAVSDIAMPPAYTIDAGTIGKVKVAGVLDGYAYAQTNAPFNQKTYSANMANGMLHIYSNDKFIGFSIWAGANTSNVLGAFNDKPNFTPHGTMKFGYLTINPNKHFQIGIGQIASPEGLECGFDYKNSNIVSTTLSNVQTGPQRGVQLQYSSGPYYAYMSWSDGYYTNRYNFLSWLFSYSFNKKDIINFYGGANLGHTGYLTNQTEGDIAENNSTMFGGWLTYNLHNLTITPEVQYQYAPKITKLGLPTSSSNITAALFADYELSKHYTVGSFVEYAKGFIGNNSFKNNPDMIANANYLGYGLDSSLYGLSVTPTYSNYGLFARLNLAYMNVSNISLGDGFGVTGMKNNQFSAIAEIGFVL
ncbi:outer membrane beta-barrel protein [Acidithiobacillus sp. HP-6]|uniref:outer membrane beta-barrel protein n=1 Tax=unclassified Acidithiobacillus TaxID=2614800 RepID=UPI00187985B4|nr:MULTISPECIES: outer membrane beta-barrel protein [unclassified Acidithiobacillus]MBE7563268.1 outer membrane beta-barrel protein [Acidithiobacillus sp. HP-6]MBE7569377.1 outer membrane beta-barrel protein [Acidithiobacillus sp. HP-2]